MRGVLALGGTTDAAFDLGRIGSSATSFQGFEAFNKTGTSTWTLNGANAGTSNWSVQQGTLALSATAALTGGISVASGAALSVAAGASASGATTIANGGRLALVTGATAAQMSALTLNSGSTIDLTINRAGNTTALIQTTDLVLDGTLNIVDGGGLAAGTYRLFSHTSGLNYNGLDIGSAPIQFVYDIRTNSSPNVNLVVEANIGYWNGSHTVPNGVVNGGSGTWNASATNWTNATGATARAWGGYEAYFDGVGGSVTVDAAGVSAHLLHFLKSGYTLSGGSITLESLSSAKPIVEVGLGVSTVIQSVIAGTAGLEKTGAGTLLLSGANTYTGNTTITTGLLQIDGAGSILGDVVNNGALGFTPSSDLTFAGNITGTGRLVHVSSSKLTLTGVNTYSGSTTISAGTLQMEVGSGASLNGIIGNSGALIINTNTTGLDGLTLGGVISGTGSLTKNGGGSLKLLSNNTYTGLTTVTAGVLYIGFGTTTGAISGDIVNNAPVLSGGVNSGQGVAFFRSDASTYSGVISGTGQVGVGGGGSLTLTGENTYTGDTFITGATLIIGDGATSGSVLGNIQTNFPGNPAGTVAFNRSDVVTFPGAIFGTGGLEQRGSGTLILSGANTYTGGTVITQGTIQVGDGTSGSLPTGTNVANSGVLAFNQGTDASFSGIISGTGSVTKMGPTALTVTGVNTYSGGTTISGGTLVVSGAGWLGSGAIVNNGALVNNTSTTMTVSSVISGTGSLTQSGAMGVILTGNNTFTGGTTISAGGIDVGSVGGGAAGTTTGDIGNVSITNATSFLAFYRSNAYTYGGVVSGVGMVNKGGDGTTTFTGENTYSGVTQVARGTLQIGDGSTSGWIVGNVQILSGATLAFNRSDDRTFGGAISGAGALTKLGAGTLTLTGANTYTGDTTISAGTLVVGNSANGGSIAGDVLNNATLAFDRSDAVSFAGNISGTGTINKQNANTLTLTGNASAFSGTTNVNAGTLALSTSAFGGNVNVFSGATLTGAGNASGTVTVQNGGTIVVPTGGTTSYGMLALSQTSQLSLTLPASANSAPFYSVTNLTLNGVLNIASGGSYSYGTYRLMDYSGSLTDNTLDIGASSPWQYTFSVVVDAATQQVNLVVDGNTAYWNGTSAPPSGTIRGGTGTWTGDPATLNWTDRFGTVAGDWLSYKAVFAGAPGTVTIDNTYAQVQTAGMQFAVDGYTLTGGNLLLSNTINPQGQIPIQVGNGTPAGAGMSATISTVLNGTQGMTKTDLGTLILTVANTYTGGTTIAGGTLQLGSGGTTGSILGDVVTNGTLAFNRSDAIAFSGDISGTGGVTQSGGNTLTLSGTNTYSGATNVVSGTLIMNGGSAIGDLSAVTVAAGASLTSSAGETIGSLAGAGSVTVNALPLTVGGNNGTTTFSGVLSGTAGLIKTGTGTLTLSGINTNTGGTTVSAGRLVVSSGYALSDTATVSVAAGATLELLNANETVGALSSGGAVALNANTLTVGGGNTGRNFSGTIGGTGGLTKVGTGQQSLTGTNTYTGATLISAGTLIVSNGSALSDQSAVTVNAGAIFGVLGTETIGSLAGAGSVMTNAIVTLTTGGDNSSTLYSGVISELAGAITLEKIGTGTMTLTGANTYVGGTTISGGTLQIGNAGSTGSILGNVANNGALAFKRSDDLTYAGEVSGTGSFTQAGSGVLTLTGTSTFTGGTTVQAGTLQIGAGGTAGWLAGAIANSGTLVFNRSDDVVASGAVTGTGALVQRGTGKLTLAGNNSAGAGTSVEAGTLEIVGGVSLASNVTVQSGATLKGENSGAATATINGTVNVLNGGTLLAAPSATAGSYGLSMTGLTLANTANLSVVLGSNTGNAAFSVGTLALDGVLNVTDAGAMSLGVYRILDYTTLASDGGLRLGNTPLAFAYEIQQQAGQVNLAVIDGSILFWNGSQTTADGTIHGGTGTWTGATGTTNWTTSPANQARAWNNGFAVFGGTAGTVTIDSTSAGAVSVTGLQFMVDGYTVGGDTLTLAALSGQTQVRVGDGTPTGAAYAATIGAVIAGSTGLEKTDLGTLILTGANIYTGGTTITQGTLQVGDGGTSGSILGDVVNNGVLAFNRGDNSTYAGAISGTGSLTKAGDGTLTLSGTNSFSGATSIMAGRLLISGGSSLSDTAGVTIAAAGTLELQDSNETIGSLSGAGDVALNSYCLTVAGGGAYSGSMSGTGCLVKTGTDTLTLSGASTYGGATDVNAGTVIASGGQAVGDTSAVTVASGAQFIVRGNETVGSIAGTGALTLDGVTLTTGGNNANATFAGAIGGTGGLSKTGTGTQTLTGANTYTGATAITGGQLAIGGGASLSDTATLTIAAGAGLQLTDADETIGSLAGAGTVTLGGNCLITGGDNSSTSFSGSISGSGCITKTGTLALTGTSTYSGTTTVSGGTVQVTSAGALGTGALALEGIGTLRASETFTYASAISLAPVSGVGGGTFEVDAAKTLTLTGAIAGLGDLDKTGTGTLVLGGTGTYGGATNVNAGSLIATGGHAISDTGAVNVASGAHFILQGSETVGSISGAGAITLDGATLTTGGANTSTTFSGIIGGSGGLTKSGSGVLTLSGANTYTGNTQVAAGGLNIAGSLSGDVYVQNLATLSGNGTVGGTVHVLDGGTLSGAQFNGLTMGGLDLSSAAILAVTLGAPSSDSTFNVNGNLTLDGTLKVTAAPGFGIGIYRIVNYTGTLTDNGMTVGSLGSGLAGGVQSSVANQVNLVVEGADTPIQFWNGTHTTATQTILGGDGTWSADAQTNWTNASATIPKSWDGGFAVFQGTAGTVTVDNSAAQVTSAGMQFVETGYMVTGGAIALAGTTASIRVGDGTAAGASTVATIDSALIGTAGLEKSDFGTLILIGNNSYAGGTTVSAGTLQIGNGGTSGAIIGNVLNNGVLAFNRSDSASFSGAISGTGGLVKLGSGTLNLTGASSYTGGTSIRAGTLQISSASGLGTGGLALSGTAALQASTTFATANAVSLTAVGGAGGGTFDVDAGRTLTLSGTISGSGGLLKDGDGLLILTGASSYAGLTTISAGTLQIGNGGTIGSIAGDIVNNASLVFNRSDTYTFSGAITGSGSVAFTGGGTVLFSSPYTGPIAVNGSTVQLQPGSVTASPFTINNGGKLGGTATIGGLTVNSGGTVAPGYSPGTLTVSGPVTFNSGSVYAVDVTPGGAHDLITATGAVTLSSGATVSVLAAPGRYDPTSSYAIITTTDTVTGTFGSVTSDYAFLTPVLTYDAKNVFLTLTYNGARFVDFATTSNEVQVAVAAQTLGAGNAIFDALFLLSDAAVAPSLDQLTGEVYASASTVIQRQSLYLREAVGTRLRQSATGTDALSATARSAGPATARLSQELTPTMWMQGHGGWGNSFGNRNAATISNSIGGFFGGLDVNVTDAIRVGIVGGFSQSTFDVNARKSSGSMDNYDLALYAGGQFGALALRGGLAYAWHDMSVTRSVNFPGYSGSNSASYMLGTAQVFGEVGYGLTVGAYAFEPFAGLAYVNVSGGSFTEGGSIGSALKVDGASQNTLYSTLGLRAATSVAIGEHTLSPSLTVGWQHAFGDTMPTTNMLFAGGATPFQIQGVPIAENVALLGAGLAYQFSDAASLEVNYTGQIASQASQNAFSAQFSLKF
ncbi:autotransporter-associated beta strand repeat-containing protein [Xanthobacteraceae bacterium A53D]